jgi:hypothetical protein
MFAKDASLESSQMDQESSELPTELPPLRWRQVTYNFSNGDNRTSNKLQYKTPDGWRDVPMVQSTRRVNGKRKN